MKSDVARRLTKILRQMEKMSLNLEDPEKRLKNHRKKGEKKKQRLVHLKKKMKGLKWKGNTLVREWSQQILIWMLSREGIKSQNPDPMK